MYVAEGENLTSESVSEIQHKIRNLKNVQVVGGGKPGEDVNKMREEQAKGMRSVLRDLGKKGK